MNKMPSSKSENKMMQIIENAEGRVGVPVLLYFLGVPGFLCVALWLFFFRGH